MKELNCLECGICCFFGLENIGVRCNGILVGEDGWCVYHDKETKKCGIYETRPDNCKNLKKGGRDCLRIRKYYKIETENE